MLRKKIIKFYFSQSKPICTPGVNSEAQIITPEEVKQMQCTKVVFLLLDFLDRWVREWQWKKGVAGNKDQHFYIIKVTNFIKKKLDSFFIIILFIYFQTFQNELCKLQLAKCNYHCGEYPRALMYLEDYIKDNPDEFPNNLAFFAEVRGKMFFIKKKIVPNIIVMFLLFLLTFFSIQICFLFYL